MTTSSIDPISRRLDSGTPQHRWSAHGVALALVLLGLVGTSAARALETGPPGFPVAITDGVDTGSYIAPGDSLVVPMSPSSDEGSFAEWHRTTFRRGVVYEIEVEFDDPGTPQFYTPGIAIFELSGAGGTADLLAVPNGVFLRSITVFPEREEDHFVAVDYGACILCDFPVPGTSYEVRVLVVDDFTGTTDTNGRAGGSPVFGAINDSMDQEDYFRIELTAGEQYVFDLRGASSGGGTLVDPLLILVDASSNILTSDDNGGTGNDARIVFTPSATGSYFLIADRNLQSDVGTYVLESSGGNIPGDTTTSATLEPGDMLDGLLNNGSDVDAYRMQLEAGRTYAVELNGNGPLCPTCTLVSPVLDVVDPNEEILFLDDDSIGSELPGYAFLAFQATRSGAYFARVRNGVGGGGTYGIALFDASPAAVAELPPSEDTKAQADSHLGTRSTIDAAGDVDWLRVFVAGGETHAWQVRRTSGSLVPVLSIVDPQSPGSPPVQELVQTADGATVRFDPPLAGEYYVAVRDDATTGTGEYELTALEGEVSNGIPTWAQLHPNTAIRSAISFSSDEDYYRMGLQAGVVYTLEMSGAPTGDGTLPRPFFTLRDGLDVELLSAIGGDANSNGAMDRDESPTARLEFTVAETGTYFAAASRGPGLRLDRGSYEIRLVPEPSAALMQAVGAGLIVVWSARRRVRRARLG